MPVFDASLHCSRSSDVLNLLESELSISTYSLLKGD